MRVSIRSNQFLNPPNVVTYLLLGYIHLPAAVGARLGSDRGLPALQGSTAMLRGQAIPKPCVSLLNPQTNVVQPLLEQINISKYTHCIHINIGFVLPRSSQHLSE